MRLTSHSRKESFPIVVGTIEEALMKVEVDSRETIDRHGVEQFLPPVVRAVYDVHVHRQEHSDILHADHRVALGRRQRLVDARKLHHNQPVFALLEVPLPRRAELQHAELTAQKGAAQQTDDALAVFDRLLDAAKNHPTKGEVPGVVAHTVPTVITLVDVPSFQTVDDLLSYGVIRPRARDEGIECHVLVFTLVHVERMKVERGKDLDTTAVEYYETRADQKYGTSHRRYGYLQFDKHCY